MFTGLRGESRKKEGGKRREDKRRVGECNIVARLRPSGLRRAPIEARQRRDSIGGEKGIRTPDTVSGIPDFESGAFNHSAISP